MERGILQNFKLFYKIEVVFNKTWKQIPSADYVNKTTKPKNNVQNRIITTPTRRSPSRHPLVKKKGQAPMCPAPYQLPKSYLKTGSLNCANFSNEDLSTSACKLLPWESIVTTAVKPSTRRCHIASGIPNCIKSTPSTPLIQSA
jgi:hypothetical protein